jgi:membrane-associated phospholipid phosphatase
MPLAPLVPRLVAIAILAVLFVALTMALAAGTFTGLDRQVADAMHSAWQAPLHPLFQGIAELGGVELTSVVMLGLTIYLLRSGFGSDAWVVIAFIAAQALEVLYKFLLHHPAPPRSLSQSDGPSLSWLVSGTGAGNSFPSGHMLRSVIAFGLLAFVVRRLSTSPLVRGIALAAATVIVVLVAFDRVYLNVHWESDVVGGLILGAIGLLAGTVWLDRPRSPSR